MLPTRSAGLAISMERNKMLNLVEKFTPETVKANDEGVVAIEYVLVAVAVAAGVLVVFATPLWTELNAKLSSLF